MGWGAGGVVFGVAELVFAFCSILAVVLQMCSAFVSNSVTTRYHTASPHIGPTTQYPQRHPHHDAHAVTQKSSIRTMMVSVG